MNNSTARVLVCAYACNPFQGSEEGVGWSWLQCLPPSFEKHVLVAAYHQKDIQRLQREQPDKLANIRIWPVPPKIWHFRRPSRFWNAVENGIAKPLMNLAYAQWQRDAYRLAKRLHAKCRFDLVHQITYVGYRFAGHLWKLDAPFIWGPVGGLDCVPVRLLPLMGAKGAVYYAGRNTINALQKRFLPLPKQAFRKASAVIAATSEMRDEIRKWYGVDSEVICEVGPPPVPDCEIQRREPGQPLRIAWSGLHLPGKALPLLLDALPRLNGAAPWELHILGDGPCRAVWRRHAEGIGLNGCCRWHGQLPRERALAVMAGSHAFAITSLKDLTSTVLLEALALGLPVVCLDHCGFRDVVTPECGIKIPVGGREAIARGFAEALERLARDEGRRRKMAEAAKVRAREFSWEKKTQVLRRIYEQALAGR